MACKLFHAKSNFRKLRRARAAAYDGRLAYMKAMSLNVTSVKPLLDALTQKEKITGLKLRTNSTVKRQISVNLVSIVNAIYIQRGTLFLCDVELNITAAT